MLTAHWIQARLKKVYNFFKYKLHGANKCKDVIFFSRFSTFNKYNVWNMLLFHSYWKNSKSAQSGRLLNCKLVHWDNNLIHQIIIVQVHNNETKELDNYYKCSNVYITNIFKTSFHHRMLLSWQLHWKFALLLER